LDGAYWFQLLPRNGFAVYQPHCDGMSAPGQEQEPDPNDPKEQEIDRKKKELAQDMSVDTEEEVTRKMGQLGKYIDPSKKLPFAQQIKDTQQAIKSAGQPIE